jgi:hypothetical protein
MAIYRRLQGRAFDPAAIQAMVVAFEETLRELNLASADQLHEKMLRRQRP